MGEMPLMSPVGRKNLRYACSIALDRTEKVFIIAHGNAKMRA
jgi:hypothetical protein